MRKIKLLAVALMLSLAGVVYAAGNAQDTGKSAGTDSKAGCCATCCKSEDSCCKSHKMGNQKAGQSSQENKDKACASCECCKDGKTCCKNGQAGKESACAMSKETSGCCASGAAACGDSCCAKDKQKKAR
jgi:hypothetical protein